MKRILFGLIVGAVLGVFCIIGASLRMPSDVNLSYLIGFWYNRVLMGLVIGLFPKPSHVKFAMIRGIILGLFVSFAFYISTDFLDLTGFLVGAIYGIIIELSLFYMMKIKEEQK